MFKISVKMTFQIIIKLQKKLNQIWTSGLPRMNQCLIQIPYPCLFEMCIYLNHKKGNSIHIYVDVWIEMISFSVIVQYLNLLWQLLPALTQDDHRLQRVPYPVSQWHSDSLATAEGSLMPVFLYTTAPSHIDVVIPALADPYESASACPLSWQT